MITECIVTVLDHFKTFISCACITVILNINITKLEDKPLLLKKLRMNSKCYFLRIGHVNDQYTHIYHSIYTYAYFDFRNILFVIVILNIEV